MIRKTSILVAALLACTLTAAGLTACSGASDQSSATAPTDEELTNSASSPTDEELIRADIEETIGAHISKEELAEGLKSDESAEELMQYGFDIDALAENLANNFKIEVTSVEVDGDTAVATIDMTLPNFGGDAAEQMLEDALEKKLEDVDPTQMSEEDAMKLLMDTIAEVMSDPNFPTETESLDLDYVKKDGQWSLKDADDVEANLAEKMFSALGV